MERMLVVVFDNETKAYEGTAALRQLDREGSITIFADAVVVKNPDGSTTVKQFRDVPPTGSLVGTSVGALVGVLGGPAGMALGSVTGLALGALFDVGDARVGQDFVEEVSQSLTPNKVAVVAEIEEHWTAPVDTRMEALGGTVHRRALWEVEEKIRNQDIAAMKADLAKLKEELAKAHADRRAKLQSKAAQLEERIEARQKQADESWKAFQGREKAKRELFMTRAAAAGSAIKQLAKTPPL